MRANPWSRRRLARSSLGPAVALTSVALALGLLPAGSASADSLADAKAAAHVAAMDVARLQPQVSAALTAYERAATQLGRAVTNGLTAQELSDQAQLDVQAAQDEQRGRIRALYRAGGSTALLATVLSATDPQDLARRVDDVRRVMSADSAAVNQAQARADAALTLASSRQSVADRTIVTAGEVAADLDRLNGLLDAASARLAQLSSQARSLQEAKDAAAAVARQRQAALQAGRHAATTAQGSGIPPDFLLLYRGAAATCPGLDWHVLAAIGQVESGHGRNNGPSSSGAMGPMQFLQSTFDAYAIDGNHDGVFDIWNPADAIYSAANYLCQNGAGNPRKLYGAIFRYNHADWYVQMVLNVAAKLTLKYPG